MPEEDVRVGDALEVSVTRDPRYVYCKDHQALPLFPGPGIGSLCLHDMPVGGHAYCAVCSAVKRVCAYCGLAVG
jgi:hypothetical protein